MRALRIVSFASLLTVTASLFGQVVLSPITNTTATVNSTVTLTGTGFPAGVIAAAGVTVTITPPPGNGQNVATMTLNPASVLPVGSVHLMSFKIPGALVVNQPLQVSVSVSGNAGGTPFTTTTPATLTIYPPAAIESVSPGAATVGTAVDVMIGGPYTHFIAGQSAVTVSGAGVTASNIQVQNANLLKATLTVAANAIQGARNVTVTTPNALLTGGNEIASLTSGFVVSSGAGLSFSSIAPNSGTQGQTKTVTVTGTNTHWVNGTTTADFGDGVKVNSVTVTSATTANVNIAIKALTYTGFRMVTLVTGGEYALSSAQGFLVNPSVTSLVSSTPGSSPQGTNLHVLIAGQGTHFLQDATTVSFGSGINVGNVAVTDATHLDVVIAVGPGASVGPHDIIVTTGYETESLGGAFNVTSLTPFLSSVSPQSGGQGASLAVTALGYNTNFVQGSVSADFGSNITVNTVVVNSPTSVTFNITINVLAGPGGRSVILHTPSTDFPFSFSVAPSTASISNITPTNGPQGAAGTVTLTGNGTHWVQGTTFAFFNAYIGVNRVTVTDATHASVDFTAPPSAPIGGYTLTLATGGEVVSAGYAIFGNTPSLAISPGSGMIGTTVAINLTGQFTHFVSGTTTLNISGQGVAITNYNVSSLGSATAKLVIDATAPTGVRTLTMTSGNEIVTVSFVVTSTPAQLIFITPNHSSPSTTLDVAITGQYTSFAQGTTTVTLGPNITINSVTVSSPTLVTANISIAANAAFGYRTAFVNTGAEQLQIGFRIDSPSTPLLGTVSPSSGQQGQTVSGVSISGINTHWDSTTQLILGAGVTVNNLQVLSATQMTCNVVISPTAPVGGNSLVAITGSEIATGTGFSVTPGVALITSVTPSILSQNQTVTLAIVGSGTHWLQGGTVANFGGGIVVDQLTINNATHATATITVLSLAGVGLRGVSFNTDGELATIGQGLDIEQGTPTLLSTTPNSGLQGETKNIQILGRFTHFVSGTTNVNFGTGITTNSVTASDSVTAIANVTIDPLAFTGGCRSVTVTTGTEQVSLPQQFCVGAGPAQILTVSPAASIQGSTVTVTLTGLNTHWVDAQTTANFGSGVNVNSVHVTSPTSATVTVAVSVNAPTGFHSVSMTTLGESSSIDNSFTVSPGVPTLNGVSPVSAQQGTTATLHIIGQFTHWGPTTTVTVGQGITLNLPITVTDAQTIDASITVDPLAYTGGRSVTVTTGTESVSGNFFGVVGGPALISGIDPSIGNQGQERIINITGQGTHWSQGLSQFNMSGNGYDLTVNGFIVNSATSATVDITLSPTAGLGTRSVYISTAGENVSDEAAFVTTGGIPSITYLSPGSAVQGTQNVNVTINGIFTNWNSNTTVDFGNAGITMVGTPTINSATSITAVVNVAENVPVGNYTVTVRTGGVTNGGQTLTANFGVSSNAPPTPYIYYFNPSVGLPGQTFTTTLVGQYTNWTPSTQLTFGAGVQVNTFQVTSPNTALINLTINPGATAGSRTVTLTTGTEVETTSFSVVIATPFISIVDPSSALQGETGKDVNVIGQYTAWNNTTTFNFGAGVTVNSTQVLGPSIARVNIAVTQLAALGGRSVTATTGTQVDSGAGFSVTPSLANIQSVTPNTAMQNDTPTVTVVGQFTHWVQGTTQFSFGGGISVTNTTVTDATHATLTLNIAPLANLGGNSISVSTQGEQASLGNAFIVQPGTPLILSSAPSTVQQQNSVNVTILGQYTSWVQGTTTVNFGPNSGITVNTVTVTVDGKGITANITAAATTPPGYRTLYVVTGGQTLTLPYAIAVVGGPAAVTQATPPSGTQGATSLSIDILGTNTNFINGVTTATFGSGIAVGTLTVTDATHATALVTIAANATPGFYTITLSTLGETAVGTNVFLVNAATPILVGVSPVSGVQGDTNKVITVVGAFTHFVQGNTTADFGAGITGTVTVADITHATVSLNISATAVTGNTRTVQLITNLQGGAQEVAVWTGHTFTVNAGNAAISLLNPASGKQNQTGLQVTITGTGTHFDNTSTVTFNGGVTTTLVTRQSATSIVATVNVSPTTPLGTRDVTVTTGGEIATLLGGFTITPGAPILTSINPTAGHQNDTLDVGVNGQFTNFVNGTTTANFGAGITVNSVNVTGATTATVNITIGAGATLGVRAVTMTTGTEVESLNNSFTVQAGLPSLVSITPVTGAQNSTQTVTVNGLFTTFTTGSSVVTFNGGGVTAGTATVNGPTTLTVSVTVTPGAAATARTITVTTGSQVVSLVGAFTVLPGAPTITAITPNLSVANVNGVNVNLTGLFTHWDGTTQISFGPGISVGGATLGAYGPVSSASAESANVVLNIDASAVLGARDVTVKTGTEVITVNNGFTVQSTTPTAPNIVSVSPQNGAGGVPVNTSYKIVFNGPIDPATVHASNVGLNTSCTTNGAVPATINVDASGRIVTITPSSVLAVGTTYTLALDVNNPPYIMDPAGHIIGGACYNFTTGFTADASGPSVTMINILNGDTIGTNVLPNIGFDKPIDPSTQPAGLTVTQAGAPVPGIWGYNADYTQATFTPAGGFSPSTAYLLTYSASLKDSIGNSLLNPGSITFTAGAGADNTAAVLVSFTPIYDSTTGENPTIRVTFSKEINPLTLTLPGQFYLYRASDNHVIPGTSITVSPDRKTFTMTLPGPLDPSTQYHWVYSAVYDQAGHYSGNGDDRFVTGPAVDNGAPHVVTVSPAASSTSVPVNSPIQISLSEIIDPTSFNSGSLTLTPSTAGTVSLSGDGLTITLVPAANLASNQGYTVNASGFLDQNGNLMTPFSSTFTTSAAGTVDTARGTIAMAPADGSTNIPTNASVVYTFSKAINPASLNTSSVRLYDNTSAVFISGAITASTDRTTVTFAPGAPLEPNHQYCAYVSYYAAINDVAGNAFFAIINSCFVTAAGVDTTPPTVVSVMPINGATGIGPNNPVTITFSKPMNPGTLNSSNAAIYIGSTLYTRSYGASFDNTTLTFNTGTMPYGTTYTVVVTPNVADLAGNTLAAEFRSSFTTAPQPLIARPAVNASRPISGATSVAANSTITLFVSAPLNTSTVPNALKVSQNGVQITGTINYASNNQVVTFTPSTNFLPGAHIQVFFGSSAADTAGNFLFDDQRSFTVAVDNTIGNPVLIGNSPPQNSSYFGQNAVVEARFDRPLNPSTVNAGTFYVNDCSDSTPISGTISLLASNTLLRFTPSAPYPAACQYFYVHITNGLKDTNNHAFAGTAWYDYYNNVVDTTSPTVTVTAPTNNAVNIGTNAILRATFSEAMDTLSVDPTTLTLSANGQSIPYTAVFDASQMFLTITPQAPLPPSMQVTLGLTAGLSDLAGNPLTPQTVVFTTSDSPDFVRPTVVGSSVVDGQGNVPVNSSFTFTYSKPMDARTFVLNSNLYLYDNTTGYVPATFSFSPDGTQVTITPTAPLKVNTPYQIYTCSVLDLVGNVLNACSNPSFSTALTAPVNGPQVTFFVPADGMTNVPTNFTPQVQFDRVISPTSLGSITLTQNGTPVSITPSAVNGATVVNVKPASLLSPNKTYVVTVTGVKDVSGTPMSGSITRSFTTGPSIDLVVPAITAFEPQNGVTTGTHPVIRATFNEPINPISGSSYAMYNQSTSRYLAITLVPSADLRSLTFTYPGNLDPNTVYCWNVGYYYDLAGNQSYNGAQCFLTTSGVDSSAPTVVSVTPPSAQAGTPINAIVQVIFNKAMDATTLTNASMTLSPAAPSGSTLQLSADGLSLSLAHSAPLTGNTQYTISVTGLRDVNGNLMTPFTSSFSTSTVTDTVAGTITLSNPAPGASGVAVTSTITVQLSKAVDPNSVNSLAFVVRANDDDARHLPGTISIGGNGTTLTFTPTGPMPSGTSIYLYVGWPGFAPLYDLAGNAFNNLFGANFTTATTADTTAPTILTVTPSNGATNVGPSAVVTLTFSKALDANTINGQNFTLYNGFTNLGATVNRSYDNRTVTLSVALPYSSTITLAVSTNVKDMAGNSLAAPLQSTFSTVVAPLTATPSVIQMRPGNGATGVLVNTPITLYMSAPLSASTGPGAVYVSQNGALISGAAVVSTDGLSIVWTPSAPYLNGANIQVFFTGAADTSGNPFAYFGAAFTTTYTNGTTAVLIATTPGMNSYYVAYQNTLVELQFSKPLDPSTVNGTNFFILKNDSTPVTGTLSLTSNNTVLRFVPSANLADDGNSSYYRVHATGLKDVDGSSIITYVFYFYPSSLIDNTPPMVQSVSPGNGQTAVGDNATIRVVFNKSMDTLSINTTNVALTHGATAIPYSLSFNSPGTAMTVTPQTPLPDNASITLTLTGLNDTVGLVVPTSVTTFQTGPGADFSRPYVVYSSIDPSVLVPVNASVTIVFSKPLDPGSIGAGNFRLYDNAVGDLAHTVTLSPDGKTATLVPSAPYDITHNPYGFQMLLNNAVDLDGNLLIGYNLTFYVAATDITAPQVSSASPADGATGAPLNALIDIQFNEAVASPSLSQITLKAGATPVPFAPQFQAGDSIVRLVPNNLLAPFTTYTITVTGVQDTAGNTMAGTFSYSFTTGANALLTAPHLISAIASGTPLTHGVTINNIPDSPVIVFTFDTPLDLATISDGYFPLRLYSDQNTVLPTTISLSTDHKTLTVAATGLQSGVLYRLLYNYYGNVRDWAGNGISTGYQDFYFITQ